MEAILSIISGGFGGALLACLLRGWISERLKRSIQHEYAQKLETHKAELNTNMQTVLHERQLHQLRTSLFFDHQREAFASLLSQIAETERKWFEAAFDPEEGFTNPVPSEEYNRLKKSFYDHQLFLDRDCILAIDLVLEAMSDSFPFDDGSGQLHYRDCREPYDRLEFLRDRVAGLFREKIGVGASHTAKTELALLGTIRLLNCYSFPEIDLPAKGALKLTHTDNASSAIIKAEDHRGELIAKLKELKNHLEKNGFFHEASERAKRYLDILDNKKECPT